MRLSIMKNSKNDKKFDVHYCEFMMNFSLKLNLNASCYLRCSDIPIPLQIYIYTYIHSYINLFRRLHSIPFV